MNLVIVGNGFDLRHGLKTSYYDFRHYILKHDVKEYEFLKSLINDLKIENLWNDLESKLKDNDFYNFKNDICISNCNLTKDECLKKNEYFLNDLIDKMDLFKRYLCEWIKNVDENEIESANTIPNIAQNISDSIILSFNYTSLIERKYKHDCHHIHGFIKDINISDVNDLNKIIFGFIDGISVSNVSIGNSNNRNIKQSSTVFYSGIETDNLSFVNVHINEKDCLNDLMQKLGSTYNDKFKKHRKNIINNDSTNFFKKLKENANNINEIIAYGHSLTEIDRPYFQKIIEILEQSNNSNAYIWKVSYHKESEKEKLLNNIKEINKNINVEFIQM